MSEIGSTTSVTSSDTGEVTGFSSSFDLPDDEAATSDDTTTESGTSAMEEQAGTMGEIASWIFNPGGNLLSLILGEEVGQIFTPEKMLTQAVAGGASDQMAGLVSTQATSTTEASAEA